MRNDAKKAGGEFKFCDNYNAAQTDGTATSADDRKKKFCQQVSMRAEAQRRAADDLLGKNRKYRPIFSI